MEARISQQDDVGPPGSLDDFAVELYRLASTDGPLDIPRAAAMMGASEKDVLRARDVLTSLHLMIGGDGGVLIAGDPGIAEFELRAPLQREIIARQQSMARVHQQLRALTPIYEMADAQRRTASPVRTVTQPSMVRQELASAAQRCRHEIVTMQPGGGRRAGTLNDALIRDLEVLGRGISMRSLYQRTARASLATQNYVRKVTEHGSEVRVTTAPFERLIIIDREVAFVPQKRVDDEPPGAAVVSDPTVVDYLYRCFEHNWQWGEPFFTEELGEPPRFDAPRMAILRLMASGLKDDVIARQLGMATRTCRRYVAEIFEELNASSRFDAGVRAAQLGLVNPTSSDSNGE